MELDKRWKPKQTEEKIALKLIGRSALLLQLSSLGGGTKDSDVIETDKITPAISNKLKEIAGKNSVLHKKYRLYLDIVPAALPFLPMTPIFHEAEYLCNQLEHFRIETLDVIDVAVSKLKPMRPQDREDIRLLAQLGALPNDALVKRFCEAIDRWLMDARAEDLPKYIENLHTVQRDLLFVPETQIKLPSWFTDKQT